MDLDKLIELLDNLEGNEKDKEILRNQIIKLHSINNGSKELDIKAILLSDNIEELKKIIDNENIYKKNEKYYDEIKLKNYRTQDYIARKGGNKIITYMIDNNLFRYSESATTPLKEYILNKNFEIDIFEKLLKQYIEKSKKKKINYAFFNNFKILIEKGKIDTVIDIFNMLLKYGKDLKQNVAIEHNVFEKLFLSNKYQSQFIDILLKYDKLGYINENYTYNKYTLKKVIKYIYYNNLLKIAEEGSSLYNSLYKIMYKYNFNYIPHMINYYDEQITIKELFNRIDNYFIQNNILFNNKYIEDLKINYLNRYLFKNITDVDDIIKNKTFLKDVQKRNNSNSLTVFNIDYNSFIKLEKHGILDKKQFFSHISFNIFDSSPIEFLEDNIKYINKNIYKFLLQIRNDYQLTIKLFNSKNFLKFLTENINNEKINLNTQLIIQIFYMYDIFKDLYKQIDNFEEKIYKIVIDWNEISFIKYEIILDFIDILLEKNYIPLFFNSKKLGNIVSNDDKLAYECLSYLHTYKYVENISKKDNRNSIYLVKMFKNYVKNVNMSYIKDIIAALRSNNISEYVDNLTKTKKIKIVKFLIISRDIKRLNELNNRGFDFNITDRKGDKLIDLLNSKKIELGKIDNNRESEITI